MSYKNFLKFNNLKKTSGQALLLVILVSVVALTIVVAVVDRTSKQLNIQRQNASYQQATSNAQSAVEALVSYLNTSSTPFDPTDPNFSANISSYLNSSSNSYIKYKIQLNQSLPSTPSAPLVSDQTLTISPYQQSSPPLSKVNKFELFCPTVAVDNVGNSIPITNIAVVMKVFYYDSGTNTNKVDNIASTCTEGGLINGGSQWVVGSNSSPNPYTSANNNNYNIYAGTTTITGYNDIIYQLASPATLNVQYVQLSFKTNFNTSSNYTFSTIFNLQDSSGKIIGSSVPLTGTAIGYGDQNRTSTLNFSIPSTSQLPNFLDYVFFEGQ